MTDLTPERRGAIRHHIALRERAGHTALLVNHLDLTALLDAADERDRLAAAVERVRAVAERYEADALSEGYGGELWSTTAAVIRATLEDGTDV